MAHILIIEDDDIVAELASVLLTDAGHRCQWAANGEEALALLMVHRPDLVLLDNDMPGMSGPQILRKLRDAPRDRDLPVIMLTSASGIESEEAALFAGAQDYIRKPFDPRAMLIKVGRLLHPRADFCSYRDLTEDLPLAAGSIEDSPRLSRRAVS